MSVVCFPLAETVLLPLVFFMIWDYLFIIIYIIRLFVYCKNMKREVLLYPKERRLLVEVGKQIKLARLRRKISCEMAAERAKISRVTLWKIEKGDPTVSMGAYLSVLFALRLERDILFLAKDDDMGRALQDKELLWRDER